MVNKRPSRCLNEKNAPQEIHWAPVGGVESAVADELVAAIASSVPESLVMQAVLDMNALIERIERCEAVDPDDVVPVASHPSLWEYRINDHASGVHLRIYCAEVSQLPDCIVALHAHAKFVDGTDAEIKERQDQAISLAKLRFAAGELDLWGLARKRPST